ncbi:hypothetical protein JZ751_000865 [Albula glossodonta]|uniref:Uncharacterized protein n=1 Tax=Albula glossodonta TaxID=121402 RepID=A0A8T2PXK5_9TELE|nr:hypothetical protein JZ751_016911 [Albula glossodonta]KAG9356021.1 hypothetical protein JZ751_000865 [Albula glossodonta]
MRREGDGEREAELGRERESERWSLDQFPEAQSMNAFDFYQSSKYETGRTESVRRLIAATSVSPDGLRGVCARVYENQAHALLRIQRASGRDRSVSRIHTSDRSRRGNIYENQTSDVEKMDKERKIGNI